jgi:hypothetical protein
VSQRLLEREALRLQRRYALEIVEAFGLCPFAERARVSGASTESVVLDRAPTLESVLRLVRRLGDDVSIEVAFVIFPRWEVDRVGLSRFVEALRSAHQSEPSGLVMTMEGFHPVAEPRTETPGSLVPFLRRTPDPVIQLTRLAVLERARQSSGGTTKYVDPSTVDVAALLAAPPDRSLHERISDANHRTVLREGVRRIEAVLEDIRRDRDATYARLDREQEGERQGPR